MLLLLAALPGSVTEVVTLSGPTTFCSALSLLCHCGSPLDVAAPAESVVPVDPRLRLTERSIFQADARGEVALCGGCAVAGGAAPCSDCVTEYWSRRTMKR